MRDFPFYQQLDEMDCGPACLKIILKYYGKNISIQRLRELSETTRVGSNLLNISKAAEKLNVKTLGVKISITQLEKDVLLPCIAHLNQKHFVVVYKVSKKLVYVSDPALGLLSFKKKEFLQNWIGQNLDDNSKGIVLLLEPTSSFHEVIDEAELKLNYGFIKQYLKPFKRIIVQLLIGLFASSIIQLIFPFLTQAIVDVGIQNQNINFIYLVLLAQLMLFIGRVSLDVIRGWILLHIGSKIKITLISDFFIRLMKRPISFFDYKVTGDILQRINDNKKIESFLTFSSLGTIFSLFNIAIFGVVLLYYNANVFGTFLLGSILYFIWIVSFQKQRLRLNYKLVKSLSDEQTKIIELIQGMQEIKMNNAEIQKRWSWERIQAKVYKIEAKSLALEQYQVVGASFINELKNILITIMVAKLVIEGQLTLGMMLSVSYIIGQLNSPLIQIIEFLHSSQNAKISVERLLEINNGIQENEIAVALVDNPGKADIRVENVHFKYQGAKVPVLENITFSIPNGKTTAIVGPSGSGKTTLMKLLLNIYQPSVGEITVGNDSLKNISTNQWRSFCGVVLQEGFIFNDTIANNIALGQDEIDKARLYDSANISNVLEFLDDLPAGLNTKIGAEGLTISTGQKQRILIARAVYKNPNYIFLDEATSALDSTNEKTVVDNLNRFVKDRTLIIIAHRLSTVRNADQIVVLDKRKVVEIGTHESLLQLKGCYYNLIKDQLALEKLS